jgi:hypothetical protein
VKSSTKTTHYETAIKTKLQKKHMQTKGSAAAISTKVADSMHTQLIGLIPELQHWKP